MWDPERIKMMKKRIKKLKARVLSKGLEYEKSKIKVDTDNVKSKVAKLLKNLQNSFTTSDKTSNIDRFSAELNRLLQRQNANDIQIFESLNGSAICIKLIEQICQSTAELTNNSSKSVLNLINLLENWCHCRSKVCGEIMMTNQVVALIELLVPYSNALVTESSSLSDGSSLLKNQNQYLKSSLLISSSFIHLLTTIFTDINLAIEKESDYSKNTDLVKRSFDILSLLVSFGIIDELSVFFNNIQGPIEGEDKTMTVLENCLNFMISITRFSVIKNSSSDLFLERKPVDTSQLVNTLNETNLVNIISMLYGMLHRDASTPIKYDHSSGTAERTRKQQPPSTIKLTTLSLKLLNQMISLDLFMMQVNTFHLILYTSI